ncbi:DUF4397 domain-containing protein [Clostridium rectalis]|uniref:DUF4397 domain-containing protein n=1 Tax=Clostridium rectalis TaxID=2040295 RepID=UPI000F62EDB8|nr:DUF4397 domain-containing protein [Clostridium rectalis]
MFICPFFQNNLFRQNPQISYLRLLHASPDAPKVDVYLNNKILVKNLEYKDFTDYFAMQPGYYVLKVYPSGSTSVPVIDTNIFISNNQILTGAILNFLKELYFKPIEDTVMSPIKDKVMLRFAHLSPNTRSVNVSIANSGIIFTDISFSEVTQYEAIDPGIYGIQVRGSNTDDVLLLSPNIILKGNNFYTIYLVGLSNSNPPLQLLVPLDGNSYIKF